MASNTNNQHASGINRRCSIHQHDLYAYNPTYEWTSYKTVTGMILSYLTIAFIGFYMFITTRDYVVRPPEMVSQGDIDILQTAEQYHFQIPKIGLRLGYTNVSDTTSTDRIAALDNNNPYVRYEFRHVVVQNQQRVRETVLPVQPCIVSSIPSTCPMVNRSYMLQGVFYKEEFEFLEIVVNKCVADDNPLNNNDDGLSLCAPLSDINDKIQSGQFRIRAQVSLEAEQFDVETFHATGVGSVVSNRSMEYFALPNLEVQSDIVLKARKVQKEQRYAGSPPLPETETNILSFDRREINYRPRTAGETNLMTFMVRIDDNVRLEEVAYWCPSILDLFGLWGAMASFAATLSLGAIAMWYNKWRFHRHFTKMAHQKRHEAQLLTLSAMEWMRKKDNHDHGTIMTRNRQDIYQNLQTQHDALLVEPDIRLFESHHFDWQGRVSMSAAELKYPSTAFGELRRLAILEHGKKRRAAEFLSLWYGRHLVQKGFIKDPERRKTLFSGKNDDMLELQATIGRENRRRFGWLYPKRRRGRNEQVTLRRRRRGDANSLAETSSAPSRATNVAVPGDEDDLESGRGSVQTADKVHGSTASIPSGGDNNDKNESEDERSNMAQQKALDVISAMDPMSMTRSQGI